MGKLGISIYPERSTYEKDKAYLDLAHQYGFKRVFTSLLQITEDKEKVLADFKKETVLTQRMTISRKIFGAIQLKTKVTGNSFLSRRNKETE